MTIWNPLFSPFCQYISKQALKLAFVKFGRLISVFKGIHPFKRTIRISIIDAELSILGYVTTHTLKYNEMPPTKKPTSSPEHPRLTVQTSH